MDVETVRVILERTFQMPVAESDAQIVLDRLGEIFQQESRPTKDAADWAYRPEWGRCFWCGKPATYVIGKEKLFACEEHGSQAESNGWPIHKHKDAQPLI